MKKLFCLMLAAGLWGCGFEETKVVEIEKEVPVPVPGPPDTGTSWAEMRQLFQKNCARCHGNDRFGESEQAMRQSRSEAMIKTGRMPPNQNGFTDGEKMLAFF